MDQREYLNDDTQDKNVFACSTAVHACCTCVLFRHERATKSFCSRLLDVEGTMVHIPSYRMFVALTANGETETETVSQDGQSVPSRLWKRG